MLNGCSRRRPGARPARAGPGGAVLGACSAARARSDGARDPAGAYAHPHKPTRATVLEAQTLFHELGYPLGTSAPGGFGAHARAGRSRTSSASTRCRSPATRTLARCCGCRSSPASLRGRRRREPAPPHDVVERTLGDGGADPLDRDRARRACWRCSRWSPERRAPGLAAPRLPAPPRTRRRCRPTAEQRAPLAVSAHSPIRISSCRSASRERGPRRSSTNACRAPWPDAEVAQAAGRGASGRAGPSRCRCRCRPMHCRWRHCHWHDAVAIGAVRAVGPVRAVPGRSPWASAGTGRPGAA